MFQEVTKKAEWSEFRLHLVFLIKEPNNKRDTID